MEAIKGEVEYGCTAVTRQAAIAGFQGRGHFGRPRYEVADLLGRWTARPITPPRMARFAAFYIGVLLASIRSASVSIYLISRR